VCGGLSLGEALLILFSGEDLGREFTFYLGLYLMLKFFGLKCGLSCLILLLLLILSLLFKCYKRRPNIGI
jgi:hypothetical protein